MPLVPKRIAIISVGTSKGYADFMKMINDNTWGYRFFMMLFPAVLQGPQAVPSIVRQLKQLRKIRNHFDVVAIVRGGGGDIGLTCYNHFELAKEICLFPLPVITGIGHSTNETVAEMIAFKNAITPTDLAGYLLQRFHDFSFPLQDATRVLQEASARKLQEGKTGLVNTVRHFRTATGSLLQKRAQEVKTTTRSFTQSSQFYFKKEKEVQRLAIYGIRRNAELIFNRNKQFLEQLAIVLQKDVSSGLRNAFWILDIQTKQLRHAADFVLTSGKQQVKATTGMLSGIVLQQVRHNGMMLSNTEKLISLVNPQDVLKRGYSITMVGDVVLKYPGQVQEGDALKTIFAGGVVISTAIKTIKPESDE